ncbi:GNAT family N-acetyltransferase [Streptomyces sp.]
MPRITGAPGPIAAGVVPVVETPSADEDFASIDAALSEAFAGEFTSSAQGAAPLRRTQENGGAVRFVRAPDGSCAGGASCSAPAEGTAELSGVGTRPAFRRCGIAAAFTATLTEAMFAQGAPSVWLEYSGEGSRRVYERIGYRPPAAPPARTSPRITGRCARSPRRRGRRGRRRASPGARVRRLR